MHILQPKQTKLKPEEVKALLLKYNISLAQLPKIRSDDSGIPEGFAVGDVLKIDRKDGESVRVYYRVVA